MCVRAGPCMVAHVLLHKHTRVAYMQRSVDGIIFSGKKNCVQKPPLRNRFNVNTHPRGVEVIKYLTRQTRQFVVWTRQGPVSASLLVTSSHRETVYDYGSEPYVTLIYRTIYGLSI